MRRIRNALDSVYNNVALRTDKMTFDHIRQLRNFSAKVFREASITGETRRQVSERLQNEALQVPGFQFTDIAGRKWSHKSYFEMLARTELMNGARDSYEQECAEQGYNIMLLSVSGHCCEACARFEGKYFSIGPNRYGLPTKDDLEAAGVFHPNCTHSYSAVPDYIIEKEFGIADQKKSSSPTGPTSSTNLPRVVSAETFDGKRYFSLSDHDSKSGQIANQINSELQKKIVSVKVEKLNDDAKGEINSISVAPDLPKNMHGATDKDGNIVIDPGTAADLNSAYAKAKAKAGRNDFTEAELNAIETVTHEINHLRQSNLFSAAEKDRFVILAGEIVNEELTRHVFREQAAQLGFRISDQGLDFIQKNARGYSDAVSRLRNIADALGCSEKYQDFVCNELVKSSGCDKVTRLIDFFTKEMKRQGMSLDFEIFTNDFFENEGELVKWIKRNRH